MPSSNRERLCEFHPWLKPWVGIILVGGWAWAFCRLYDCSRLWANALNAYYILQFPGFALKQGILPSHVLSYGWDMAWLIFFFTAAALSGRVLFHYLRLDADDPLEELAFSLGLGLGSIALLTLFLGILGLLQRGVILTLWIALGVGGLAWARKHPLKSPVFDAGRPPWHSIISAGIILVLALMNLVAALSPEIFYDALVYHLSLPQLYLIHHKIVPTPFNIYSGVPFNAEMLYAQGLALRGEGLAKLIPWGLSLAMVFSLWTWCRRFGAPHIAWLAAALLYSCPMFSAESWSALVELHWAFFNFLAVYSLLIGLETGKERWLVLSGTMVGFCLGVKYNAFPTLAVLLAIMALFQPRARWAVLLIVPAGLAAAPWFLKNAYFYGNPVFPFFHELLTKAADSPDWRGLLADAKARGLVGSLTSVAGIRDLFFSPFAREWTALDSAGPALLFGLPAIILVKWSSPAYRRLFAAFILSWAAWSLSSRMPRFFIFALPLGALLLAAAAHAAGPLTRRLGLAALLAACLVNCGELFNNWFAAGGWSVVLGNRTKSDYLDHNRGMYPSPYYAGMEFINKKLPADSKILFIGEYRSYYCMRDFIPHSPLIKAPLIQWSEKANTVEELRRKVRSEGITHLFVNRIELGRVGYLTFADKGAEDRFNAFARKASLVFEKRRMDANDPMWVQVYEVLDRGQ